MLHHGGWCSTTRGRFAVRLTAASVTGIELLEIFCAPLCVLALVCLFQSISRSCSSEVSVVAAVSKVAAAV